jgi:Beta propeller domain
LGDCTGGLWQSLQDASAGRAPNFPTRREKIGTRGSSSQAATDHLAFTYLDDRKLLAIPMTICEGGGDGTFGDRLTFSGLLVYRVTLEGGFARLGDVDHGKAGASCRAWWSEGHSDVKRSLFMDDLVFSISQRLMKVEKMSRFGQDVASVALGP